MPKQPNSLRPFLGPLFLHCLSFSLPSSGLCPDIPILLQVWQPRWVWHFGYSTPVLSRAEGEFYMY